GLTLANLLGGHGVRAVLVERNTDTVQEPRAVSIDDESLRTIQAMGLLDEVMPSIVPGYGSDYLSPKGRCFLSVLPTGQPYGHPRRNGFRQPLLEKQLRRGLDRFPHVRAFFGWSLETVTQDGAGVTAVVTRASERRTFRSAYLVGCDGASSTVRKSLG